MGFAKLTRLDRFEPDRIVTSNLVRPSTLAILRGLVNLYTLIVIVSVWVSSKTAAVYFVYFTNLTFLGLTIYLVCSSLWSFAYLRQPVAERAQWLKSLSPWWGYIHCLLYSTIITYHIVVPIVFWTMLAQYIKPVSAFGSWQNASVHAVDGVIAVFELVFNRHQLEPLHVIFVCFVMILYMCLTFIYHSDSGKWVYPFLDWDQGPIAAVYYVGIAIGLLIVYFILFLLHKYRNKMLRNRCEKVNHDQQLVSFQNNNVDNEKV